MKRRAIALGFFDGVHIGHGMLLKKVSELARSMGFSACAMTFETHPSHLVSEESTKLIYPLAERVFLMKEHYKMEEVFLFPFNEAQRRMDWETFAMEVLFRAYHASYVVVGSDYRFGYRGEGNAARLSECCKKLGVGCDIVPPVELDGITVSSTYIRALLSGGDILRANRFLGKAYHMRGIVQPGSKLGRTLGFPTANLPFDSDALIPAFGVYATGVYLENGEYYRAITNIGVRPTVGASDRAIMESHLLGFRGVLYGEAICVVFFDFMRPEAKFGDLSALKDTIARDVETREKLPY